MKFGDLIELQPEIDVEVEVFRIVEPRSKGFGRL